MSNLVYRSVLKARLIVLIHQLGFIRAVSWIAQNAESHWSHVYITLIVENISFHAFYKRCGLQRDLKSFSSWITFKDDEYFSCTFPLFAKTTNLFNATGHHACSPAPANISIGNLLLGGGCILSISPCWPLHTYPSSLQCNFCIPDRLMIFVLWLLYVMQLSSVVSQSIFQVEHQILIDEINVKSLILIVLLA